MSDPRERERLLRLVRLGDRAAARELATEALRREDVAQARVALDVLGHRRAARTLFALRDLCGREPSSAAWRAIIDCLRAWPEREGLLYGVELAAARLDGWPDRVRVATWRWWQDLTRGGGRHGQLWSLARRLELDGTRLHAAELERIAQAPELGFIRSLALEAGRCGDAGAEALSESPYLSGLVEVELGFQALGPRAARALGGSEGLARLARLVLSNNPLGDAGVAELGARAERRGALRELVLNHCEVGPHGASALAESGLGVERLALACNRLTDASVGSLLGRGLRLTHLDLSNNALGDGAARAVARSEGASSLVVLDLGHTAIGEGGLRALAGSGRLGRLRVLRLEGLEVAASVRRLLFDGLASLESLVVGAGVRVAREEVRGPRGLQAMADALVR